MYLARTETLLSIERLNLAVASFTNLTLLNIATGPI